MIGLSELVARLPLGPLMQRAALLSSGAAIGQAAVIGVTPILASIYEPADFGALAVFLAFSGIMVLVSTLRFELAILVAEDDEEASAVVRTAASCVSVFVLLALVAVSVGGKALAVFTSTPELEALLWLLPVTVAAGGAHQIMVAWATRAGEFILLARSKAIFGVSLAMGQLGLGLATNGAHGLVIGVALSWVMAIIALCPAMTGLRLSSSNEAWLAALRYRRFPQFGLWAALLNRGALEIPAVALAALYGPATAGSFLLAVRFVVMPTRLITESVYQVYQNEAARLQREDPERMYVLFVRTIGKLARLAVPLAFLLAAIGPWVSGLVFGSDWPELPHQIRVLALLFAAMLVTQPVASTLWITERLGLQLAREVARVSFVLLAFLLVWRLRLGPSAAVGGYVVSMVAGYGLLLALCRHVLLGLGRRRSVVAIT